jgi:RNA polymerase sigma-70 factor (ECF subfamily)
MTRSFPLSPAQQASPGRVQTHVGPTAIERDAELMLQVRAGCDSSFSLLLTKHRNSVVSYLYRMVQNRAVAEELAQEAFLRVYRARESYAPTARFTTWLFRITTHLALNWIRDQRSERARESVDEEILEGVARQIRDTKPSVEMNLVARVKQDEIRHAIGLLPEKQRAAVLMHKYQEMEYSHIARTLGCSESAVKSLLFRAYETLRGRLAHYA